jgi:hypothetical protein
MKSKSQSYMMDLFLQNMPGLDKMTIKDGVDVNLANSLYKIWTDKKNKVSSTVYKKPNALSSSDIENMKQDDLIRVIGDKIEITSKGSKIIRTMILGNDKSSFEKDGDIDYTKATKNVNARSQKKETKKTSDDWWERFFG